MSFGRIAALALVVATMVSGFAATPARAATGTLPPASECVYATTLTIKAEADRIMARHLELGTHADWILPADPTWREQPFKRGPELAVQLPRPALGPGAPAGRPRDRSGGVHGPRGVPAQGLAGVQPTVQPRDADVLERHDRRDAGIRPGLRHARSRPAGVAHGGDPGAWHGPGRPGLLQRPREPRAEPGHRSGRRGVRPPADQLEGARAKRMAALVVESVDTEGASNEQSIGYQLYNYAQYERARRHLVACGLAVPSAFTRVARMPEFLAHATVAGRHVRPARRHGPAGREGHHGTAAEFAATAGASGPKPPTTVRRYAAGYLFARSGWGDVRPFSGETYLTMRFGPGVAFHGHPDGQSLTLSARGRRLLVDPGKYTYTAGAWKAFFESRAAHNVVVVDGLTYDLSKSTAARVDRPSEPPLRDDRPTAATPASPTGAGSCGRAVRTT